MIHQPTTIEAAAECVRQSSKLQIVGAQTKPALTQTLAGVERLSTLGLSGVTDYQPREFLITALAGTPLEQIHDVLASENQYLPFEPPRSKDGATLGGTVAAALSGAGRLKYGGLRDFLMGVRLVDGLGNVVTGGGRVVKNSAGYDLPKLIAGCCGRLALIVEVTLKVFPRPEHRLSLQRSFASVREAMETCGKISRASLDLEALEISSTGSLMLRIAGPEIANHRNRERLEEVTEGRWSELEDAVWDTLSRWEYVQPGERLTRVPLAPSQVTELEAALVELCVPRRYGAAGNVAWIQWPADKPIRILDETLDQLHLSGTMLTGTTARCRIGRRPDPEFATRVEHAFDPLRRFMGP